ncbi:MAG: DUF4359 domain-containing protein [Cyanobacteriota bacterium]|nr:DUF4359 domain-containing protein [Cyanobacteriota bacterium]
MSSRAIASRSMIGAGVAAAAGLGLMFTNPGHQEFERFAAEQLTQAAEDELCGDDGLPVLARLVVRDCAGLIRSQRGLFGKLALAATQRRNFVLFSLYRTDLGGQRVLPDWSIPRYRAVTLAVAGRFLLLPSSRPLVSQAAEEPAP